MAVALAVALAVAHLPPAAFGAMWIVVMAAIRPRD